MTVFSKRNPLVKNKLCMATLTGTIATLLLSISSAAFAKGTTANTNVISSFTLDFRIDGSQQATITNQDDGIEFIVDRIIDLTVDSLGDKVTMPGAKKQDLLFSLSNTGNELQAYNLRIVNDSDGQSDGHFDVTNVEILVCTDDGDGIYEPEGDDSKLITHNSREHKEQLPADSILWITVRATIPSISLATGQRGKITLIAETTETSLKESSGKPIYPVSNTNKIQKTYLADKTRALREKDAKRDHSASAYYTIDAPKLSAEKTFSIHSQNGEGCFDFSSTQQTGYALPGACVEYMFTIENTGGTFPAEDIAFVDTLDNTLKFAMAQMSGFSGGVIDHPSMEQDCASAQCNISISDAALAPGEKGVVTIRALIK